MQIIIVLFFRRTTKEYLVIPLSQVISLYELKGFKRDNPILFYVHGFRESPYTRSVQVHNYIYTNTQSGDSETSLYF